MNVKSVVKKCLYAVPKLHRMRDHILFESNPNFADNTWEVYKQLRSLEETEHFTCIWAGKERPESIPEGVRYINIKGGIFERLRFVYLHATAKLCVSCNRFFLESIRKEQVSVFLTHGAPLKTSPSYSYEKRYDYVLAQSTWMIPYTAKENDTPEDRFVSLGIPRNDLIFHPEGALEKLGFDGFEKVVVWLPTYRQHYREHTSDTKPLPMGIPLLYNEEGIRSLDERLRARKCLLVLKPHPAQDLSMLKAISTGNIITTDNAFLASRGVGLYNLLGAADALITDYSSVYYDYLLTGRPIGLTVDDFEEYKQNRGFVFDEPEKILTGTRMETVEDLNAFVDAVADGIDPFREEHARINGLVNEYRDDRSAERVAAFLLAVWHGQYSSKRIK